MSIPESQLNAISDPDIYEWCDVSRLQRLRSEIGPAIRTLRWSQQLQPIVLSWVRRELISDFLKTENGSFFNDYPKNQKLVQAREQWISLNGENALPPCDEVDHDNWYLADLALEAWSRQQWEHRLETLYLARKINLDFVSCSLIRVRDQSMAFELSLRLKGKEANFEQLSWTYGEGPERQQGGRFLKQRIESLPKALHPLIAKLKPGEVLKPHRIGDWFIIISLDEVIPAEFDSSTQSYLLSDELQAWLRNVSLYLVHHLESEDP